jgi:MoaA/NifB/PqqE/SkfB family radical SAM enzyme
MGSSLSRIYDDMDDYTSLCKEYGEKEQEVYSDHYYWLKELSHGETKLSFKDYSFKKDKDRAISRIKHIDETLKKLKEEKIALKKKYKIK